MELNEKYYTCAPNNKKMEKKEKLQVIPSELTLIDFKEAIVDWIPIGGRILTSLVSSICTN